MKNKKDDSSIVISLAVGVLVGGVVTVTVLANSEDVGLLQAVIELTSDAIIVLCFLLLIYWVVKSRFVKKLLGVDLQSISNEAESIAQDIIQKDINNVPLRAKELFAMWAAIRARGFFITAIVYLSTALFLLLNSYLLIRQNGIIKEDVKYAKYQMFSSFLKDIKELKGGVIKRYMIKYINVSI